NWRCKKHGGPSLYGTAHPNFRNRGYSKFLPGRLCASYKEHLAEESLSLRSEAALLASRIDDLLQRADTGESGELWHRLRKCADDLVKARNAQNGQQVAHQITLLLETIEKGAADCQLWGEIVAISMRKAKLMATEHKMLVDGQQLMRLDLVLALMASFADAVSKIETDGEKLAMIHAEWTRILPPGLLTDGGVEAGAV